MLSIRRRRGGFRIASKLRSGLAPHFKTLEWFQSRLLASGMVAPRLKTLDMFVTSFYSGVGLLITLGSGAWFHAKPSGLHDHCSLDMWIL